MKKFLLALSLIISSNLFAEGLEHGASFTSNYIQGNIRVTCFAGTTIKTANYRCSDSYLNPAMFSKFVTEQSVDADQVVLTYTDSKGKTRTKKSKFSGNKSKSEFNLWIWTLTQRPLLNDGMNVINYQLTKKGKEVTSGSFDVMVSANEDRFCPYASYTSHTENDCVDGSSVCGKYFRDYNYCR